MLQDEHGVYHESPVHGWFGLTYSSYLVVQRSLLEAMPLAWQRKFVALLKEIGEEFDTDDERIKGSFWVRACDISGTFVKDPLRDYRHPDRALIESLRRKHEH